MQFSCWRFLLSQPCWGSQFLAPCSTPVDGKKCKHANISLCTLLLQSSQAELCFLLFVGPGTCLFRALSFHVPSGLWHSIWSSEISANHQLESSFCIFNWHIKFMGCHIMFQYTYTSCNIQIRENVYLSSLTLIISLWEKTFKILSSSFLKYTVHYCYLYSFYCAITYQNWLISHGSLVLIDHLSPFLLDDCCLLSRLCLLMSKCF
jgi:hypothetical protein